MGNSEFNVIVITEDKLKELNQDEVYNLQEITFGLRNNLNVTIPMNLKLAVGFLSAIEDTDMTEWIKKVIKEKLNCYIEKNGNVYYDNTNNVFCVLKRE